VGNEDEDDEYNEITEAPPVLAPSLPLVPMKNLMPDPPNLSGRLSEISPPVLFFPFHHPSFSNSFTWLPHRGVEPVVVLVRLSSSFLKGLLHETQ
jgi:hypothetical protein